MVDKIFYRCTSCGHVFGIPDYPTECLSTACPVCERIIGEWDRDEEEEGTMPPIVHISPQRAVHGSPHQLRLLWAPDEHLDGV